MHGATMKIKYCTLRSRDCCVNDVSFVPTVTVLTVRHILIAGAINVAPQLFPHHAEVLIFSSYRIKNVITYTWS